MLSEQISKAVDTAEPAATAPVEIEKEYNYASINLLLGITTKKNGTVTEKIEFTYDSENRRTSKKVTTDTSERSEFYYYDANGDLVSISQKSGIDPVENLMNFYRDANGQLLSLEYKGQIFDYVYNQRGDIVAITNELAEIIARYSYDEWGNLLNIDAPTDLGKEVANANPFRYVGKFGVQYDNHTKLYFMGWRDYDAKIGRFLVADEYEGEDTNPVSFNRYLYAESDPVNNIDPDGYAPKWLKKITKGVKKATKAAYNFAIGDDIKTLTSKNTKWYQKAGAAVSIASNFFPGGGVVSKAAKAAIKGTAKAVTAVKASKAVVKSTKVVKSTAKKVASVVNIKPKTVPAPSIKSAPKIEPAAPAKLKNVGEKFLNLMKEQTGGTTLFTGGGSVGKGAREANLKKQGFQEHHIISDKNKLTKNHELLDEAGYDLQSINNKIFLPTNASLHSTRSIHIGRHSNSVSENLARQMDEVLDYGRANSWNQQQYNDALRGIISGERQMLRDGSRALNNNKRPWAK